jgi:DNA polymerase
VTDHVSIDYETFSMANLKKVGLWAYARHPSTRVLCVSWAWGKEEPQVWWPGQPTPHSLVKAFERAWLHAFNANFERAITTCVMSKLGFPVPKLAQWQCTQAVARMCGLPDNLEMLAKVLNTPHKKHEDGKRLIQLFSVPQRQHGKMRKVKGTTYSKLEELPLLVIMPHDRPDDFDKLLRYCKDDVRAERACLRAMPIGALPDFEQRVWRVDSIVNQRGVKINRAMAQGAIKVIAHAKVNAGKLLSAASGGKITSAGQRARIQAMAKGLGYELPNMQKPTVRAALADKAIPVKLKTILELYGDSNISSVAKYTAMLLSADVEDDRVRDAHAYHAAGPGRWGGRVVQTQNIPRPTLELDDWDRCKIREGDAHAIELVHGSGRALHVLRDAIRNCIIADNGYEFHVVDKASIEARVLGWLADCKTYNKAFREGLDLYVMTAAAIFDRPYEVILAGYKARQLIEEAQRKLGKDSVLGQGYGMGWKRFFEQCAEKGQDIKVSLAKKATKAFRTLHHEIPTLWRKVEEAAHRCVRTGKPQSVGYKNALRFEMVTRKSYPHMTMDFLTMRLPSGRRLWYPQPHLKQKYDKKWDRWRTELRFMGLFGKKLWLPESTYGGKLVENAVQAIARDLLAIALVKCEELKYRPVMHVHDEIVCERKPGADINDMHKLFRTSPPWAKDLLLNSGGFVTPHYKK